jgi:4-hydroxybenzoyl-CoA reductase subunit beta
MLRLPAFEVREPTTVAEATQLLRQYGPDARAMAGGTDLLPNMKHEITTPKVVVGLWRIGGLTGVRIEGDHLKIGALTTLHSLSEDPLVQARLPALAEAVGQVAGPQLRRMGTIGGNVCLDTRCVYINQTYFWRQALGFCLKRDGSVCHVVKGGRRCVAAASNDSAPVLMTLEATLKIESADGTRIVPIDDFYDTDGVFNQNRKHDELVTEISVPLPKPGTIMAYTKLRTRAAIDFPELGVAALVRLSAGKIEHADVCVTALASRPIRVKLDDLGIVGRALDAEAMELIANEAYRRCKPLKNIATEPSYRREMVPVFVRRALKKALARSTIA